jgi:hypothetical protein
MKKINLMGCIAVSLCLLSLAGCSENPLGSLKSNTLSTKYDRDYWVQQQQKNTPIWQQAFSFCNQNASNADKPNCTSVGYAALVSASKWPGYGHDGGGFGADSVPTPHAKKP